jgi:predicted nucleotidyltransferase
MMIIMVSEQTLAEVTKRLVDSFHPDQIILFGSQARGTANEHSDVDILVICPVKDNRRALIVDMYRALKGLGIAKDIVILTQAEFERDRRIPGTVARPAWLEGKILYEHS